VVKTMMEIRIRTNSAKTALRRFFSAPPGQKLLRFLAGSLCSFLLSAASVWDAPAPLVLGLLCTAPPGLASVAIAGGAVAGYLFFWGEELCLAWIAAGLLAVSIAGDRPIVQRQWLLLPSVSSMLVSACGVIFLLLGLEVPTIPVYLLQVFTAGFATGIFYFWRTRQSVAAGWLLCGVITLSLAQIVPWKYLCFGYLAAGFLSSRCSFPAASMAGLGLDLAGITPIPMTGVLAVNFCLRLIPQQRKYFSFCFPAVSFLVLCLVCGIWDPLPLPGLLLGGLAGVFLPGDLLSPNSLVRKGPTGLAQVRLEQASLSLQKMARSLLPVQSPAPDCQALLLHVSELACDTCPERKGCAARHQIPGLDTQILELAGLNRSDLPAECKKSARLLTELRRAQEQLRRIKQERHLHRTYRAALEQQYDFLSDYLRELSDQLVQTHPARPNRFSPDVGLSSQGVEAENGDLCIWFSGVQNKFYLLLCDGMGTGPAAARQSRQAAELLKFWLESGFPPEHALRSFNSLVTLNENGGCVTIDLAEIDLYSGRGAVYKWGACVSYLMVAGQLKKIGTASPPPGLSQQARETVDRLSLGRGEVLIFLSDGAGEDALLHQGWTYQEQSPGEMASAILEHSSKSDDDATAAVLRLNPVIQ